MTEPKGPVYICLDTDVQEAKIDKPMVVPHAQLFRPPAGPGANPESLRNAPRLLAEAQWPAIVAGELGSNPKSLPPMLDLAEALGRAGGRRRRALRFPEHASVKSDQRARRGLARCRCCPCARCAESRRAARTVRARARQLRADRFAELQTDSHHLARSRTAELGERQYVAPASARANRSRHGGRAAAIARAGARAFERPTQSAKQVQERRAKIEAIYHDTRKKSQEWMKKTWDEKPISQARFFSEINQAGAR